MKVYILSKFEKYTNVSLASWVFESLADAKYAAEISTREIGYFFEIDEYEVEPASGIADEDRVYPEPEAKEEYYRYNISIAEVGPTPVKVWVALRKFSKGHWTLAETKEKCVPGLVLIEDVCETWKDEVVAVFEGSGATLQIDEIKQPEPEGLACYIRPGVMCG